MNYLWVYILSSITGISLLCFILTFSKDLYLTKKLKKSKKSLILNFSLLIISFVSISLVIYLFVLLKDQILFVS
ncbi:hypothetical protein [Vagococcus fluvialis]|uniref:hypothetical protein n=1 Tax=Vagococcus fluvialis TaxID=2738 RepID=UPI001A8E437A|nr:hypothetical protein [Vagococcus fluvialis]MBO0437448.1 hypothetical protein [Vagococcus fluvialis]